MYLDEFNCFAVFFVDKKKCDSDQNLDYAGKVEIGSCYFLETNSKKEFDNQRRLIGDKDYKEIFYFSADAEIFHQNV